MPVAALTLTRSLVFSAEFHWARMSASIFWKRTSEWMRSQSSRVKLVQRQYLVEFENIHGDLAGEPREIGRVEQLGHKQPCQNLRM